MALGVLNNLSAIYAENNLNNTNNSLQTVLEQLSSGSKINSGADDAAGLSLVNGLAANSAALMQSETNATEGVGLLEVADGALSQVTNLLDRAITLATEASNGTLNTTQEGAANQEYQSILAEVNNIGQTTTYNQQQVFNGSIVAIYTGDSSTAGSSIDDLNIRTLSESSVGDTGGIMAYSDGSNNIFLNLSTGTQNAQATDTLNANGSTTINVNYLVKGANGTETTASTSISVGGTTNYANTANGLISAINNAGLGLTASFTTQAQAGVTGGGAQTGIEITGGLVSAGVDPSRESTSGTLNPDGIPASELLTQGQTITVKVGDATAAQVTIDSSTSSLANLAQAINNGSGGTGGVTATVTTNGDGTQSLSLADANVSGGALTVTTGGIANGPNTLSDGSASVEPVTLTLASSSDGAAGSEASAMLGISGTNSSASVLTGSIVLSNNTVAGASPVTFVMGVAGVGQVSGGATLGSLATAIAQNLGVTASVGSSGITLTSASTGTTIEQVGASALTATPSLSMTSSEAGAAATLGTDGKTTLSMVGGDGYGYVSPGVFSNNDTLTGSIVLANGNADSPGTPITFVMGGAGANGTTVFSGGATLNSLLTAIDSGAGGAAAGIGSAAVNATGQIVLTSSTVGTTITMGNATNLVDTPAVTPGAITPALPVNAGSPSTGAKFATSVGEISGNPVDPTIDTLAGSVVLTNGLGSQVTYTMGGSGGPSGSGANIAVGGTTLSALIAAINSDKSTTGITAAMNAFSTGVTLSTAATGTSIGITSGNLTDASLLSFTNPVSGNLAGQHASGVVALTDGGQINDASSGTFTGSMTVTESGVTETFTMGNVGATTYAAANNGTISVQGTSLTNLITAINTEIGTDAAFTVSASADVASGGIFVQSTVAGITGLTANTTGLTETLAETPTQGTQGTATVITATPAQVIFGTGSNNASSDTVSGSIVIQNGGHGVATTFTMGGSSESGLGSANVTVNGTTLGALAQAIDDDSANSLGANSIDLTTSVNGSGLTVVSQDATSVISNVSGTLVDKYGATANAQAGSAATPATNASAILGTSGTIGVSDLLTGSLVLSNGGANQTFTMGALQNGGINILSLASAVSESGLGLNATVVNGALELQSTNSDTIIVMGGGSTLKDTATEQMLTPGTGGASSPSTSTLTLASGMTSGTDVLTGSITLQANNSGLIEFIMGTSAADSNSAIANGSTDSTIYVNGNTLSDLENAIESSTGLAGLNVSAAPSQSGTGFTLTSTENDATAISVSGNTLHDAFGNAASSASLGSFASARDPVTGTISFNLGGTTPESLTLTPGSTVSTMVDQINANNFAKGVTASLSAPDAQGFVTVTLTSNTYGAAGEIEDTSGTSVADTTTTASLSYTAASAYSTGLTSGSIASNAAVYDSSSGQENTLEDEATFVSNTGASGGIATISYTDGAGEALNATDLTNQTDAETALNDLNLAISDVAAQDGYLGAQINTLDSISQVMSTQQENVVSAQNAIQATDYASATSNMSKYEILSQTGIAALAQANSVQQEVTKLLQ